MTVKYRGHRFWPERKGHLYIGLLWCKKVWVEGRGRAVLWRIGSDPLMMILVNILRGVVSASRITYQAVFSRQEESLNTFNGHEMKAKNRLLITRSLRLTEIILTKSLPQVMGGSLLQPSSKTTTVLSIKNYKLETVCTQSIDLKSPRDSQTG